MGVRQDTAVDRTLPERGPDSAQPARAANSPEINDCQEPNPISNAAQTQLELHCHNSSREACGPAALRETCKSAEEVCWAAETNDDFAALSEPEAPVAAAELAHPHHAGREPHKRCVHA